MHIKEQQSSGAAAAAAARKVLSEHCIQMTPGREKGEGKEARKEARREGGREGASIDCDIVNLNAKEAGGVTCLPCRPPSLPLASFVLLAPSSSHTELSSR